MTKDISMLFKMKIKPGNKVKHELLFITYCSPSHNQTCKCLHAERICLTHLDMLIQTDAGIEYFK